MRAPKRFWLLSFAAALIGSSCGTSPDGGTPSSKDAAGGVAGSTRGAGGNGNIPDSGPGGTAGGNAGTKSSGGAAGSGSTGTSGTSGSGGVADSGYGGAAGKGGISGAGGNDGGGNGGASGTTGAGGVSGSSGTSGNAGTSGSAGSSGARDAGGTLDGSSADGGAHVPSFFIGADITWVQADEAAGATYSDGTHKEILQLLKDHGFNYVRLRTFVDPKAADGYDKQNGFGDLAHTIAFGKRIKAAGMGFLLDFHYSDNWVIRASNASRWPGRA